MWPERPKSIYTIMARVGREWVRYSATGEWFPGQTRDKDLILPPIVMYVNLYANGHGSLYRTEAEARKVSGYLPVLRIAVPVEIPNP